MGKIDSISSALNTEHGIDLSTGKFVLNSDHRMTENSLLPEEVEIITGEVEVIENNAPEVIENVKTSEHLEDEVRVKRNIRDLIQKSMDLADDMFEVVRVSESPKAYEPASAFLKTLVDLNEKLLDIHDRDRKLKGNSKVEKESVSNTQNNTIICENPADILKMLKKK